MIAVALVGCGKSKEEKVLGTYYPRFEGDGVGFTLHKDGRVQFHGEKMKDSSDGKWFYKNNEINVIYEDNDTIFFELSENGDLVAVGKSKRPGHRDGVGKPGTQLRYKKVK